MNSRASIRRFLEVQPRGETVIQERPFTLVMVNVDLDGGEKLSSNGFSKVMYPDSWDEELGIKIARARAFNKLSKHLKHAGFSVPQNSE